MPSAAVDRLCELIVADLVVAGAASLYSADANEPDPRYKSYGVRADGKKQIIKTHRAAMRALTIDEKLALSHRLIKSRYGEQQSVALYLLESVVAYFTPEKFAELDELIRCLHGWSKIDSYTGSLLRDVLLAYPAEMETLVRQWNQDGDMWLRRASVVLFTRKIARSGQFNDLGLAMCDALVRDSEDLVLKGVGWALKDMMRSEKERVIEYVKQLRAQGVSSVVTLYAIRDLKGVERAAVLQSHL